MSHNRQTDGAARKPPRKSIKAFSGQSSQQKRRDEALHRQQAARRDLGRHARKLATLTVNAPSRVDQEVDQAVLNSEGMQSSNQEPDESLREYYARQLMQPEWLTDMPENLCSEWYVMPRPEGRRCLVISSQQMTISRHRNGSILHRFPSILPNGSRASMAGSGNDFCILDCIFHEPNSTYYIIDMMCWKGYALYDCSAEFRLFWVQGKLAECTSGSAQGQARYPFVPVPAYTCSPEGLQQAYSTPVPFQRDGLYLLHKEGHYSLSSTPLAVLWKDSSCSQYFVDTDANGVVSDHQSVTLEYRMDQTVATADSPPVVLGQMPHDFVQKMGSGLRPGKLLRFDIGPGGLQMQHGQPTGADLKFTGVANQRRGRADVYSKVDYRFHTGLDNSRPCILSMSPAVALQYTPALSQLFESACHDSVESCESSTDSGGQPPQAHLLTNLQAASEPPILSGVSKYRQVKQVGQGTFGTVIQASQLGTDFLPDVAIKLLPRGATMRSYRSLIRREILHQSCLEHPFIISIKEVFLTKGHVAIAMEYAHGGDLYQHVIARKPHCRLPEDQARWIFQQLLIGLDYCHKKGVANRDLKLENLLLDRKDTDSRPLLKICDFGYSKHDASSPAKTVVGTPVYMAPEIILAAKHYDAKKADLWSCGVILFALLYGRYPFDATERHCARKVVTADYTIPEQVTVSAECKTLMQRLLCPDPKARICMEDILAQPWFCEALPTGALTMNDYYMTGSVDLSECMRKVDGILDQAMQMGFEGEDLSQANVIIPKADFGAIANS
ncbi:TPA: hypothetical protein ACH3X2_005543 [Trebouxia sp. C0005]